MKALIINFIGVTLLWLTACQETPKQPATDTAVFPIDIISDSVHISYDDKGKGDTSFLLLHGWGIDRTYWEAQVQALAQHYRVVAIDLPGFGQSGKSRKQYPVEAYGKDVARVIDTLHLKNVILVGHSMSGAIIVETSLIHPQQIIALVGIDNFKNIGYEETPRAKIENDKFYQQARRHFKETIGSGMDKWLFAPSTDSLIKRRVKEDILSGDSWIAMDVLERNDHYPLAQKLAVYKHTVYLVNSSHMPTDTAALHKLNLPYQLLEVGPTGHYPMLEKPEAVTAALQRIAHSIE